MTDWAAILSIPLIQNMFIATIVACVICGVVGTFVVVNRMVSVTGGISHTMFGGVGFAYYVSSMLVVSWFTPMLGALLFGCVSALALSIAQTRNMIRQDSAVGMLWAVGMAAGVIFMSLTDRTVVTPLSYEAILFGDVLFVGSSALLTMGIVSIAILAAVALFYREFQILTFDGDSAKILGVNVPVMNTLLYLIMAIACAMVANIVGIIMVIALMTIPAAMANLFAKNLRDMMTYASLMSSALAVLGLFAAIALDTPPGATAVLFIGCAFVAALVLKRIGGRKRIEETEPRGPPAERRTLIKIDE